jgi:hypothetical protein
LCFYLFILWYTIPATTFFLHKQINIVMMLIFIDLLHNYIKFKYWINSNTYCFVELKIFYCNRYFHKFMLVLLNKVSLQVYHLNLSKPKSTTENVLLQHIPHKSKQTKSITSPCLTNLCLLIYHNLFIVVFVILFLNMWNLVVVLIWIIKKQQISW